MTAFAARMCVDTRGYHTNHLHSASTSASLGNDYPEDGLDSSPESLHRLLPVTTIAHSRRVDPAPPPARHRCVRHVRWLSVQCPDEITTNTQCLGILVHRQGSTQFYLFLTRN